MSIQSKMSFRQAKLKRRLYDNKIKLVGQKTQVIKLSIEEDDFGNRDFTIVAQEIITGIISIPGGEILLWNSSRAGNNPSEGSGVGVYDILPIDAWFKFSDKVEKGDILVYKYLIDPETKDYHIQAFQVVNKIGKFSNNLLFVKYVLAKHMLDFTNYPEITPILNAYKALDEEGVDQWQLEQG